MVTTGACARVPWERGHPGRFQSRRDACIPRKKQSRETMQGMFLFQESSLLIMPEGSSTLGQPSPARVAFGKDTMTLRGPCHILGRKAQALCGHALEDAVGGGR